MHGNSFGKEGEREERRSNKKTAMDGMEKDLVLGNEQSGGVWGR